MKNDKLPHRPNDAVPEIVDDKAHARGHRHLGPPPKSAQPHDPGTTKAPENRPWVPTNSFVGRNRRSPHQ